MQRVVLVLTLVVAFFHAAADAATLALVGADLRAFRECAAIDAAWSGSLPAAARTLILESDTRIVLVSDDERWQFGSGALRLSETDGEPGVFAAMVQAVEDEFFRTIQCIRQAELAGGAGRCSYASLLSYARRLPEGVKRERLQALIGERINALPPGAVMELLQDPTTGAAALEALQAYQALESDRLESLDAGRTILEQDMPEEVRRTVTAFLQGAEPKRVLETADSEPVIRLRGADGVDVFMLGFATPAEPGALAEILANPRMVQGSEGLRIVFTESPFGPLHEIRLDAAMLQRFAEEVTPPAEAGPDR